MALKVGIVGLPNVGKSTLFNALLKKRVALSANYPFATIEPNTGVVAVPDTRLDRLAELVKDEEKMVSLPPIVPAVVEFVDIAGLVKGASTGAGLGNQFLSHIREVDAIVHVLRDFSDPNIVREGSVSPDEDKLTVEIELALSDLQTIDKLIDSAKKETKKVTTNRSSDSLVPVLERIKECLEEGKAAREVVVDKLPLLTMKPVLYVYNVSEEEYADKLRDPSLNAQAFGSEAQARRDDSLVISARLEEELVDLSDEEKKEYLKEAGVEETGLERLIKKAYLLLGLVSFLTAGKKEVRAWTITKGTKAPQAAGVIHTDFEKRFIRAEVIEYQKLVEAGSYKLAREKGWIRTEGKDYEVKDGDVVEFLIGS
ncbi:MAG: GTP-binding protein YchF [Candidatus Daviesbacteria bacterium GW2011_GWA2_38_24]|uniref:Ribosome-binding ATPase YchF n=1 Tax=Candidatus Daviesbacteria bacterium GW2011_GWA2_38_24 TaxID=1618422 RepID=A0A0G0JBI3_9BACT|nr:MAG: GTP-binding protein YchF [Candidatus Daviesbacteria bacterium GW2011_GWA2_38_24]KKQ79876.1 MAG: GTP-binding protein YchF [Candidatus Daviesbacteria bacterium GW2011_GWA1_38_7]